MPAKMFVELCGGRCDGERIVLFDHVRRVERILYPGDRVLVWEETTRQTEDGLVKFDYAGVERPDADQR